MSARPNAPGAFEGDTDPRHDAEIEIVKHGQGRTGTVRGDKIGVNGERGLGKHTSNMVSTGHNVRGGYTEYRVQYTVHLRSGEEVGFRGVGVDDMGSHVDRTFVYSGDNLQSSTVLYVFSL